MLNKRAMLKNFTNHKNLCRIIEISSRSFSHGPYNPLHYKSHLVPEELPTYFILISIIGNIEQKIFMPILKLFILIHLPQYTT